MEQYWRAIALGHRRGIDGLIARLLLSLFSIPYGWVISLRNLAYTKGWLATHRLPGTVTISVGNIVTGGTGKTPCIIRLAENLADLPLAIISRGYRSTAETKEVPTLLSKRAGPLFSPEECGDEPFLIASRLPQSVVVVGRDRHQGAKIAKAVGATLLLLDDGMQHRRLARDFEVVVMDASDPIGTGHLLPRGFLRESPESLKRASLIVLNHVSTRETYQLACALISQYTDAPVVGMRLKVSGILTVAEEHAIDLSGASVGLFCGIAQPEKFKKTVESLGAHVMESLIAEDHQLPCQDQLHAFAWRCRHAGASWLVCTEKDCVKLTRNLSLPLPIAWVKTDLEIIEDQDNWTSFLHQVRAAHSQLFVVEIT